MPDWTRVTMRPPTASEGTATCSPLITSLAHACFHVADLERSIRFYRDVLGMPPVFCFVDEHGERFGVYIHLGQRTFMELFQGAPEAGTGRPSFAHFCLEVADLDAALAAIAERGGVIDSGPNVGKDGTRQAWLKDPDGNRIELFCYTAESRQQPWLA